MFPKIGVPQNGWFIMENPIKIGDLGVPLFLETPIFERPWMSLLVDSFTQQCFEVWCYDSDQMCCRILGLQQRSLPVCFSLRLTQLYPLDSLGTYGNSPLHELYFRRFGRWRNWQFLLHRIRNQIHKKTSFLRWIQGKKQTIHFPPKKMASSQVSLYKPTRIWCVEVEVRSPVVWSFKNRDCEKWITFQLP